MMQLIRLTNKKRCFFFVIALIAISINSYSENAHAQGTPQYVFDLANEHLARQEYEDAKGLYRTILTRQAESGGVFINLAIIAVQEDSLGLAKHYFKKASEFSSTYEEANEGLQFVESRFSRQSAVLPKLPWERGLDWAQATIGFWGLFYIGILIVNTSIAFLVASWFFRNKKELFNKVVLYILPLGILTVSLAYYVDYLSNRYKEAVMIVEQSNVVEQANEESNLVSLAYEGYEFTIDTRKSAESEDWTYVRMSNGLYGWVRSNSIKTL